MASPNLPVQLMSFIGREHESAQLHQQLLSPGVRLITITGPGGVGKTSLALQVAHQSGSAFADGAHFISLAAIRDSTLIIPTLAQRLGLTESPDRLFLESLKEFLRERQTLLLVDNFEQVISAAPLLAELLASSSELKLLVTSRESLRLRGEHEFPLAPLELIHGQLSNDTLSVEALSQVPSIALFVQRAQAIQPDFELTQDNAAVVAEICARLDGLPLAIELAAARIKLLPPKEMLARIQESSLSLLTRGARDLPVRQQTLRNTVQWSYDLLNADEQRTFRALSVFVDGCSLDAAIRVTGCQKTEPDHGSAVILEDIASLMNKSLLRQLEAGGEPRLSMLETIREFGMEKLAQKNELEAVQRLHAEFYLAQVEEAEKHLTGSEQKEWLNRLGREQENLRAALRWGFDHRQAEFILRLVGAFWQFWFLRGQWSEGRRWLEEALSMVSQAEIQPALQAKILLAAATIIRYQDDFARSRTLCEQSIALYRSLGDREGLLTALLLMSRILDFLGDDAAVQAMAPEVVALAEGLPDVLVKAQAFAGLPAILHEQINSDASQRYLNESERIFRLLDNPAGLANTLLLQGIAAELKGDTAQVQALRDEAERLAAALDDQHLRLVILVGRLLFAWQGSDYGSARRNIDQTLRLSKELNTSIQKANGNLNWQMESLLEILAAVLHRQGLSQWAARVYGLTARLAGPNQGRAGGGRLFGPSRIGIDGIQSEVRSQLGEQLYARAFAEGRALTVDDLLAIPRPPSENSNSQAPPSGLFEPLTARELEVLRLLIQGLNNPQIAEIMYLSRRTVEAHLRSIYRKFGVRSRDAAIRFAVDHHLIEE